MPYLLSMTQRKLSNESDYFVLTKQKKSTISACPRLRPF